MSALFLKLHLGLGDSILCNGMVRVFAKDHDKVFVPAKYHNADTVRWMFSDLPNVEVVSVKDDADMVRQATMCQSVGVGLFSKRGLQPKEWDKAFFEDAGVPFECRWSEFKLPPFYTEPAGKHLFVHDDPSRRYEIVPERCTDEEWPEVYMPDRRQSMAYHLTQLRSAAEIHVIDSCFLCLADQIETSAKRHVLHLYATAHDPYKKFGPPTLRKNWEILR